MSMSILPGLDDLHPCLRARIHRVYQPPKAINYNIGDSKNSGGDRFVLYLPTVCLRHDQNPSFAVACHAANRLGVPLVVLAVVVDDASHGCSAQPHRMSPTPCDAAAETDDASSSLSPSVVMTSRRLAFTLQALSHACALWSAHGAAVGIRIHAANSSDRPKAAKGARTPDHLTLASQSALVVTDEPFVSPYTTLVHRVEEACKRAKVECIRVDGSCTVPPVQVLKKRPIDGGNNKVRFDGVPAKAYLWQKKTEKFREGHLNAAMEGFFDAPELVIKTEDEDLFASVQQNQEVSSSQEIASDDMLESSTGQHHLAHLFPSRWKSKQLNAGGDGEQQSSLPSAPDVRPFTSDELSLLYQNSDIVWGDDISQINDTNQKGDTSTIAKGSRSTGCNMPLHKFALNWPGADPTVPPCPQTIGTTSHGMSRWNNFVQKGGLSRYGKERNNAKLVFAPSRMSAYLNLGIVSIFRLVWEVKRIQKEQQMIKKAKSSSSGSDQQQPVKTDRWSKKRNQSGADKFEEEIIKFREGSYAHAFARDDYDDVGSLPPWSVTCLNNHPNRSRYSIEQLALGKTGDAKWDAMQQYLVKTGELHNNVRMTWGKTVVEWGGCSLSSSSDSMPCSSPAHLTLRTLCYINDRYALDGISPPSYAGLLWCMGWTDKPSSSGDGWVIPNKPAHRYKMAAEAFQLAAQKLLGSRSSSQGGGVSLVGGSITSSGIKRKRSVLDMMKMQSSRSPIGKGSTDAKEVDKIAADKAKTKSPIIDLTQASTSVGTTRAGSSTIHNFFSKSPKKAATE